jgi:hypothetical protein
MAIIIAMDQYHAERWILERHHERTQAAERRAQLLPSSQLAVRAWMAGRLRLLADRLEDAAISRPQRPTA